MCKHHLTALAPNMLCMLLVRFDVTLHTDVRGRTNWTALHLCCVSGHREVIQYLVEEVKCDVGESSC